MTQKKKLAPRRGHITHKVTIGNVRTLYLSVDAEPPKELWLRVKQHNLPPEAIGLYDILARVISLALQHGVPMEEIGEMLVGSRMEPAGVVTKHERIKMCESVPDFIGRHLLITYCGREDLAHVPPAATP